MVGTVGTLLSRLDRWLYRYPFEGPSARRYAGTQRCGFGDLDDRLIQRWKADIAASRAIVDLGAGPGVFAARLAAAHPRAHVLAIEPSADLARAMAHAPRIRARAEALPLAGGSIDMAVCLSSIRHVNDRAGALAELRRVIAPAGVLHIVELDPAASAERIRGHARAMRSWLPRLCFGPLVVRTAPPAAAIANLARTAGWQCTSMDSDPFQPVYIMRLIPLVR
jgi:ubiquinone/menaquinone biosynthesis C-methylase UbiE